MAFQKSEILKKKKQVSEKWYTEMINYLKTSIVLLFYLDFSRCSAVLSWKHVVAMETTCESYHDMIPYHDCLKIK